MSGLLRREAAPLSAAHTSISASVAHAHGELLSHRELQFDFPQYKPPEQPQWMFDLGKLLNQFAPALKFVGWIILAAALIAIVYPHRPRGHRQRLVPLQRQAGNEIGGRARLAPRGLGGPRPAA